MAVGEEGGAGAELSSDNVAALSPDGRQAVVWVAAPPPDELRVVVDGVSLPAPVPVRLPAPAPRIAAVDIDDSGVDTRTIGWILLALGLAGAVLMTVPFVAGTLATLKRAMGLEPTTLSLGS